MLPLQVFPAAWAQLPAAGKTSASGLGSRVGSNVARFEFAWFELAWF
jgi:hypothetical protein